MSFQRNGTVLFLFFSKCFSDKNQRTARFHSTYFVIGEGLNWPHRGSTTHTHIHKMFNFRCGRDRPEWARMLFNFQFSFFFLATATADCLAFLRFYRWRAQRTDIRVTFVLFTQKNNCFFSVILSLSLSSLLLYVICLLVGAGAYVFVCE